MVAGENFDRCSSDLFVRKSILEMFMKRSSIFLTVIALLLNVAACTDREDT